MQGVSVGVCVTVYIIGAIMLVLVLLFLFCVPNIYFIIDSFLAKAVLKVSRSGPERSSVSEVFLCL